ncbi:MAG TPA: carbohydrate kinase family protein [Gaiellaceae bacterium]|nr:carbohydrate kinase family protein [Gaiellaceae bacterium]
MRFLAVGDVLVDVTATGREHDASVRLAPGGSATNAALEAVRAGAEAELVGRVGDDAAGRMLRSEVEARGVRASLTIDPDRPTGTFLVVDCEVRVDRGANAGFLPEYLPPVLEADATLVSGHLPEETVHAVLERSRAPWNALAAARLTQLPPGANAVFLNETEARRLTDEGPADTLRLLGQRYRLVCVTRGEDGAVGILDGEIAAAAAEPSLHTDASWGAGDAFAAAVLAALATGAGIGDALVAGCRAGALALSGRE